MPSKVISQLNFPFSSLNRGCSPAAKRGENNEISCLQQTSRGWASTLIKRMKGFIFSLSLLSCHWFDCKGILFFFVGHLKENEGRGEKIHSLQAAVNDAWWFFPSISSWTPFASSLSFDSWKQYPLMTDFSTFRVFRSLSLSLSSSLRLSSRLLSIVRETWESKGHYAYGLCWGQDICSLLSTGPSLLSRAIRESSGKSFDAHSLLKLILGQK